jgi:hypothetical protein
MKEVSPSPILTELLSIYNQIGGHVDFVCLETEAASQFEYSLHKNAALYIMQILEQRHKQECKKRLTEVDDEPDYYPTPEASAEHREKCRAYLMESINAGFTFNPGGLNGEAISPSEFYGQDIDLQTERLIFRGFDPGLPSGFTYAFIHPPYQESLEGVGADSINRLFLMFCKELFGHRWKEVNVFKWSTDWCSYFDQGYGWAENFLWTVESEDKHLIVGIACTIPD